VSRAAAPAQPTHPSRSPSAPVVGACEARVAPGSFRVLPTRAATDMADIMKLLQQAQEMQGRMQQMQGELEQKTVTAAAGGGMVTVEADGKGQLRKIKIDPSIVSASDVEMLEDLILVAVSEAQKKATALAQEELGKLTGGMNLPFKMPF
jgi:DNA-binding YbaB/EbfC family protein